MNIRKIFLWEKEAAKDRKEVMESGERIQNVLHTYVRLPKNKIY